MDALLLVFSIIMNLLAYGVLRNEFCKKEVRCAADLHIFNALYSVLSAVTLAIIALCTGSLCLPSMYTIAMGVGYGVITALCAVFTMKGLETGPLSYTNVIVSCGMVIPSLSGMLFFGESISNGQYIGIALMIVSIVCAVDNSNKGSGMSVRWLLLCLGAFLTNGLIGLMQKIHQSSNFKGELSAFLIIAFLFSAVYSLVSAFHGCKKGQKITVMQSGRVKKLILFSVICGAGIAFCNHINMYLAGVMQAIIFYPVVNGASMLLNTIAGVALWREKLSPKQWLGLVTGGAAIILLCGIF